MNLISVVLLVLVGVGVVLALIAHHKSGSSCSCGGNCDHCTGHCGKSADQCTCGKD